MSFCKVPEEMKNPSLRKTSKLYLFKGSFFIDFLSTLVVDLIIFSNPNSVWIWRVKCVCVFKAGDIKSAYMFLINKNYGNATSLFKKKMKTLANLILYLTVGVHLLTCIWIKLGSYDRSSWLYITNTHFTKDSRSIYD